MSLDTVTEDLARRAPHLKIVQATEPTPTVATAAAVHGVEPGQIAKTLAFWIGDRTQNKAVLIVAAIGIEGGWLAEHAAIIAVTSEQRTGERDSQTRKARSSSGAPSSPRGQARRRYHS